MNILTYQLALAIEALVRASRRWHARYAYRQARARSKAIRDQYTLLGAELLHALRTEADAHVRMSEINNEK